jgi:hypothetical protein
MMIQWGLLIGMMIQWGLLMKSLLCHGRYDGGTCSIGELLG